MQVKKIICYEKDIMKSNISCDYTNTIKLYMY